MNKKWFFRIGLMACAFALATFVPVQVSQGTTWPEFQLKSQEVLSGLDLIDLNHPGLFPDLAAGAPKRVAPRDTRVPVPPTTGPTETETPPIRPDLDDLIPLGEIGGVQRIHFDYDKSDIKPEFVDDLKKNADFMKKNRQYKYLIEGHCDERGSNEYNIALGERRANATKRYLIGLGVEADRMITKSWGEEKPLDLGKTEKAYALNRRAEFFAIRIAE